MKSTVPDPQQGQTLRRRIDILVALSLLVFLIGGLIVVINFARQAKGTTAGPAHSQQVRTARKPHADATGLYVGGQAEFYKLDPQTGSLLWSFPISGKTVTAPAVVVNGIVYFGSIDGALYALHADSGQQLWRVQTNGAILGSPAVDGNAVYVGSSDGNLYAFDAQTGAKLWSYNAAPGNKATTVSSAVVVGNTVYASATNGTNQSSLFALNTQNGNQVWQTQTSNQIFSAPQVSQGKVYVVASTPTRGTSTTGQSQVDVFDATNGSRPGQTSQNTVVPTTRTQIVTPPTVSNGTLYIGGQDGTISAINANSNTPAVVWHRNLGGPVGSSVVATSQTIFAGISTGSTDNNSIVALNPSNGAVQWQHQLDRYAGANIVVSGDILYVGTESATIYALDVNNGAVLWSYQEPNAAFGNTPLTLA